MEHRSPSNGEEFESACSTPFASAPSSPGRGGSSSAAAGFFFSAPSSPMHYILSASSSTFSAANAPSDPGSVDFSFDFEFSARFPSHSTAASADELFLNGQIRPMKLSSRLQRHQELSPLPDLGVEEGEDDHDSCEVAEMDVRRRDGMLRSRSVHRRTRSLSPMRNLPFRWRSDDALRGKGGEGREKTPDPKQIESEEAPAPPVSASSRSSSSSSTSSSSSSGRSSKRWIFLKDLLHRSKSERSDHGKEKFWRGISFSVSKDRPKPTPPSEPETTPQPAESSLNQDQAATQPPRRQRPVNGLGRRRRAGPSAHERLYTANRAQAEEMRRRTFLPYRQGLLGCLWFSSRSYGAINGFARSLNPVSSRWDVRGG